MIDPSSSEEESDEDQGGRSSGKHSTPNHHHPKHASHPKSTSAQNANQHVAASGPQTMAGRQNIHGAGGGSDGSSMSGNTTGPGASAPQHMSHHTAPNHQPHHSHPNAKELQNSHLHHAGSDTSGSLEVPNNAMPR